MTTTLADAQYVEEALAALERCKTDTELTNWDDRWCSDYRYINLPEHQVKRLEAAYDNRVRWICGVGAG